MMKQFKMVICLFTLIFAFGSLSWADEQKEGKIIVAQKEKVEETTKEKERKEVELESITVTTTRESVDKALELRREYFMGSAYTMDIETIEESGAFRWGDLMRRVPGIMVREDVNRLRGMITSRGLGHSDVLQIYEGIPAAAMLYGFGCALQQIGIQPERVGGIEILRGPTALEYGTNTVGGIINYFDYPLAKDRELRASQVIGSNAESTTSIRGGVALGESIGTRAYLIHKQGDDCRQRSAFDINDLTVSMGSIRKHGTTWRFTINVSDNKAETPSGLSREQYESDPTFSSAKHNEVIIQYGHIGFSLDHPVSEHLNVGIKSYVNSLKRQWWIQKGEKNSCYSPFIVMGGIEPFLRIKIGENNRFSSGVRLHMENQDQRRMEGDNPAARHGKIVESECDDAVSIAWYGIDEHDFTDRLSGLFGMRIDHFRQSRMVSQPSKSSKAHNESTEVVPSVGLRYRLTPDSQVFANVSRSYKPPKYGQLVAGDSQQPEPQQGTTYELGTRSLLGNILSVDTTLFYNDYDNLVTSENDPTTGETIYTNQGHTMQRGLEFACTLFGGGLLSNLEGLSLYTAVTLLDTEIKAGENKGNELPYAPDFTAYTDLRYEHGIGPGIAWGTIGCLYVGDRFSDDANTKVETADAGKGEIPSYSVWTLNGGYRFGNGLSLQAGVRNLFDRKYISDRSSWFGGILPGASRTFYTMVNYEF